VDVVNDRLDGKVALISGGARGIGRRIAATLAEAGARVVLTSRSAEAAEAAARDIRAGGNDAAGVTLDVADHEGVESTVRGLLEDYGTIPVLVNNAGATRDCLLLRMKKEEWDFVLETNLTGIYHLCRAVVPSMVRARYGRIVNITSVVAQAGNPGQVNYAASKAGIEGFTRSLARELASRGITVNCVAPGFIDTDMTRSLGEAARASLLEKIPMQRSGRSEEVAEAVRFLATPEAGYITGTTLNVNGGMYM
jgi:3-oxoacyl-[acyl-carrier protein] reductase